jgi:hypothetical protein
MGRGLAAPVPPEACGEPPDRERVGGAVKGCGRIKPADGLKCGAVESAPLCDLCRLRRFVSVGIEAQKDVDRLTLPPPRRKARR